MKARIISTALMLFSLNTQANIWFGIDGGYQQTAKESDLTETNDKTGLFGSLGVSYAWQTPIQNITLEPSLSFFMSNIKGTTSCCGDGSIDTQAFLFELPILWQRENFGMRFRPGAMVGEDLNFNIRPTGGSKTALLSIGADAFRSFAWNEKDFRAGVKWTYLPADPASTFFGLFLQMSMGTNDSARTQEEPAK